MNPSLLWLGAALFTWGLGEGMFLLFQPIYLSQLGADPIQIGIILGASGAAMTLAHIPAGHLSDRLGRRPLLIASWVIGVISALLMAFAGGLAVFVAGLVLYGFTAFVISPMDSYVTAARGKWTIARAITLMSMAYNTGMVLGPITGGWLGDHLGLRSVYFVSAAVFGLSTLFVWFIAPQPRDNHDPENPPAKLRTNRGFIGFLAVYFVVALATYLPQPLTPNFLQGQRGLSLSAIGQLGSIGGLGNTLLNVLLGQLEARSGFLLGQVGVAAFVLLLWRGPGFIWFAVGYFLMGGYRVVHSLGVAQVRPFVHDSQMGLAYGVAEMLGSAAMLLAPPIAGFLYDRDPTLMYPVGLIMIGVAFIISLIAIPRSRRLPHDHIEFSPDI